MRRAPSDWVRTHLVAITLGSLLAISSAHAGGRGGGGGSGSGGRLGQVSGGLGKATTGDGPRGGSPQQDDDLYRHAPYEGTLYARETRGDVTVVVASDGTIVRRIRHRPRPDAGTASVDVFVGLQKVHQSDGAASASLALEDRWFRLAGAVTRYHEDRMDGGRLTLTVPTILLGVRLDDRRGTRAFLEGGAAFAVTRNDPVTDSSVAGPIIGVHVEHSLGWPSLVGDAHAMFFEAGVRAYAARVGVRLGPVEAALRVLDFNVGPALFGPEIGLRF